MHIQPSVAWYTAACVSLVPIVSAFYPYKPHYGDSPTVRPRAIDIDDIQEIERSTASRDEPLTFPLRRIQTKRTNNYNILKADTPKQENSVGVDQDGTDFSYMVAVKLGSSDEEYHLLLDSAASNTWVMGADCTTDACNSHNTFGKGDSTSLTLSSQTFSITYGSGQVSGTLANDTLHISTFNPPLSFGLATNVSNDFKSYPMDGILGLGRGDTSTNAISAPSLLDTLSSQSLIKSKLFGLHLSRTSSGVQDGELDLGEPNSGRFDGDLTYISTISNDDGFWEIAADDAGVDGKVLGLKGRSAIIDSGTSFVLMPPDDAVAVHKLIPGYTQSGETFTVPCKSTQTVQFVFGGATFNISTADYIGGNAGNGACKSNIIGRQTFGDKQWLVGDVFLKNAYAVFDFDKSRVGFGVKKQGSVATASASASSTGSSGNPTKTGQASGTVMPSAAGQESPGASASSSTRSTARLAGLDHVSVGLALIALVLSTILS